MEEVEYRIALRKVLDENSEEAVVKLNRVFDKIPEKTEYVDLMIFPDQDGEGTFAVRVTLNGPDLYVLNKEIEDDAEIIGVEYGERGLIPAVPHMDAFNSNFEVNDVLADVVGEWLEMIWKKGNVKEFKKSVTICADEDYGMKLPIELVSSKKIQ